MSSLLPSNATTLERTLEPFFKPNVDVDSLRGFKYKKEALPLIFEDLIQEYGLESIRLWISDPERILTEGLQFQRLRGTPQAMKMALGWANLGGVTIEEEGPGEHFAEFQLGIEELPLDFSLEAMIELANQAKPIRSRLMRLFNSHYDRRHLILDCNEYGDYLDGYSGVQIGDLIISFGRPHVTEVSADFAYETDFALIRDRYLDVLNGGIFRLDDGLLDQEQTEPFDAVFIHEHVFIFETANKSVLDFDYQKTHACLAKALIVLDDGPTMGSENATFGASTTHVVGSNIILDNDNLSETIWKTETEKILERFTHFHDSEALYDGNTVVEKQYSKASIFECGPLDVVIHFVPQKTLQPLESKYTGAIFWHDYQHLNRPWNEEEPIVAHFKEP